MDCPKCQVKMNVLGTYAVGGNAQTQRMECPQCLQVCTALGILVYEEPKRGQGAYCLAKRLLENKALGKEIKKAAMRV